MKQLVESIIIKEYTKADQMFHEEMNDIVSRKLNEAKKMYAAKMFSEQLNVDKKDNVVPLDPSKRKTDNVTKHVTKHVGEENTVIGSGSTMSVYDKEGNHKFTIDNPSSMVAYYKRHGENGGNVEEALKHMKNTTTPSYTKPKTAKIVPMEEPMKEEAKRAAMKIMQEKVRVKVTPSNIEAAQKYSNETSKEKPTDPAALFREKNRKTVVPMTVVPMKKK